MTFDQNNLEKIKQKFSEVESQYEKLFLQFYTSSYSQVESHEFVLHGFMRRLSILKKCIQNIFETCPPEDTNKPTREQLENVTINLHGFIINLYGAIDNLAWIWVKEKQLKDKKGTPLRGQAVGIISKTTHEVVRKSFSPQFQEYLETRIEWFAYIEDFRHALAHRIPLYIPPYQITPDEKIKYDELEKQKSGASKGRRFDDFWRFDEEQEQLGRFLPVMCHSLTQNNKFPYFHPQVIADWLTLIEISEKLLLELSA